MPLCEVLFQLFDSSVTRIPAETRAYLGCVCFLIALPLVLTFAYILVSNACNRSDHRAMGWWKTLNDLVKGIRIKAPFFLVVSLAFAIHLLRLQFTKEALARTMLGISIASVAFILGSNAGAIFPANKKTIAGFFRNLFATQIVWNWTEAQAKALREEPQTLEAGQEESLHHSIGAFRQMVSLVILIHLFFSPLAEGESQLLWLQIFLLCIDATVFVIFIARLVTTGVKLKKFLYEGID